MLCQKDLKNGWCDMFLSATDHEFWFRAVVEQGKYVPAYTSSVKDNLEFQGQNPPTCVRCNIPMIIRSNRATGQSFWGCQNYGKTKCKSVPLYKALEISRTRETTNTCYSTEEDLDEDRDMFDAMGHF